jgi:hypothetical protein
VDDIDGLIVSVLRRQDGENRYVLTSEVSRLLAGNDHDIDLQPNDIVRVSKPKPATTKPATQPATKPAAAGKIDSATLTRIAIEDLTMAEYLRALDQMNNTLAQLGNLGPQHPTYLRTRKMVELQEQRIEAYASAYVKQRPVRKDDR